MKNVLLLMLILISLYGNSQIKRERLSKIFIGKTECEFIKKTEGGDISTYALIKFQNMKYQSVSDIAIIILSDSFEVKTLINDLDSALSFVQKRTEKLIERGSTMTYESKYYQLYISESFRGVYLSDKERRLTQLNRKQIGDLIEWLKSLKFQE